ncbi:hypothetical protein Drorol1_Dr00013678 [Drosera rotundifolia]
MPTHNKTKEAVQPAYFKDTFPASPFDGGPPSTTPSWMLKRSADPHMMNRNCQEKLSSGAHLLMINPYKHGPSLYLKLSSSAAEQKQLHTSHSEFPFLFKNKGLQRLTS